MPIEFNQGWYLKCLGLADTVCKERGGTLDRAIAEGTCSYAGERSYEGLALLAVEDGCRKVTSDGLKIKAHRSLDILRFAEQLSRTSLNGWCTVSGKYEAAPQILPPSVPEAPEVWTTTIFNSVSEFVDDNPVALPAVLVGAGLAVIIDWPALFVGGVVAAAASG